MMFKRRSGIDPSVRDVAQGRAAARDRAALSTSPELIASQNQVATLFQNIRHVLNRTPAEVAQRLQTSKGTIIALETGNFDGLPNWMETERVIRDYAAMVEIDPQPSLFVLEKSITASTQNHNSSPPQKERRRNFSQKSVSQPFLPTTLFSISPTARTFAPSDDTSSIDEAGGAHAVSTAISKRLTRLTTSLMPVVNRKQTLVAGATIVAVLVAAITAVSSPSIARFARDNLPRPFADAVTTAHRVISPPKVFTKDGMTWIVVSDPRSRRTDRLPVPDE